MATCITCGRKDLLQLKNGGVLVLQTHDYPKGHPDLLAFVNKYGEDVLVVCPRSGKRNDSRMMVKKPKSPRKRSEPFDRTFSYPEVLVKELYGPRKVMEKARR